MNSNKVDKGCHNRVVDVLRVYPALCPHIPPLSPSVRSDTPPYFCMHSLDDLHRPALAFPPQTCLRQGEQQEQHGKWQQECRRVEEDIDSCTKDAGAHGQLQDALKRSVLDG